MTLRVATVLSARPWEGDLVAHARSTAAIRLVMRAFRPGDIEARADEIDVVVAGGDVPWVTPGQVVAWRRIGLLVVGVHPVGDRPAMELFELGGADEVLADDLSADSIVQALRFLAPRDRVDTDPAGVSVAVVGARGAPGRTEVALALAWNWSAAHTVGLIDLDLEAPAVAVRLGLAARPDITDAADSVRSHGSLSRTLIQNVGKVGVVVGSHRHGRGAAAGDPCGRSGRGSKGTLAACGSRSRWRRPRQPVAQESGPGRACGRLVTRRIGARCKVCSRVGWPASQALIEPGPSFGQEAGDRRCAAVDGDGARCVGSG